MAEPIEVLPPEFNEVREAITQAPTTAPDIPALQTKISRLTVAHRTRLGEIVVAEMNRATTTETRTRLQQLSGAIRPGFGDEVTNIPRAMQRGVGAAFTTENRGATIALLSVAGVAALMSSIRDKGQKPGFLGTLLKWTGIAAFAGLMLRVPSLGRAADVRSVRRAETGTLISSLPPASIPDINDAAFERQNIFPLLSARDVRIGDAVVRFEQVPRTGADPARVTLLARNHTEAPTAKRRFRMTMLHEVGRPGNGGADVALQTAIAAGARGFTSAVDPGTGKTIISVDAGMYFPRPEDGQMERRGTEIRFGASAMEFYTSQANFNAMFNAVSAVAAPGGGGPRTYTHTIPVFLDPPGTTPRRESALVMKFDEIR